LAGQTEKKTETNFILQFKKAFEFAPCIFFLRNLEALVEKSQDGNDNKSFLFFFLFLSFTTGLVFCNLLPFFFFYFLKELDLADAIDQCLKEANEKRKEIQDPRHWAVFFVASTDDIDHIPPTLQSLFVYKIQMEVCSLYF